MHVLLKGGEAAIERLFTDKTLGVAAKLKTTIEQLAGEDNSVLESRAESLVEIIETKKKYPKHAVIVSMMIETKKESWQNSVKEINDTGCDGIELNFGCPHGMSERGMGAAVGQVPEYTKMITEWVKEVATVPVLVKLTPNISNLAYVGRAAAAGKADGISLINTINSLMGINLDSFAPFPSVDGKGSHGGYCGPAGSWRSPRRTREPTSIVSSAPFATTSRKRASWPSFAPRSRTSASATTR